MKLHANARLSVKGRELLIERMENAGWSLTKAGESPGEKPGQEGTGTCRNPQINLRPGDFGD